MGRTGSVLSRGLFAQGDDVGDRRLAEKGVKVTSALLQRLDGTGVIAVHDLDTAQLDFHQVNQGFDGI
jgi:hypothetical protein